MAGVRYRIFAVAYACMCAVVFRTLVPMYVDECAPETTTARCAFLRKMMAFYKLSPFLVAGAAV